MLSNKTAVITGGSRGIGRAIATKFAKNGANIALISTKENESTKALISELSSYNIKAISYAVNISDFARINDVATKIIEDFGKIDILVNNAGITKDNLLFSMKEDEIDDVIDVDLKGTIYTSKAFLKSFIKNKSGNVINISSVVGLMGNKGQTNYSAAKAGVIGFTKAFAKEYGKKNIRSNAIAPGYIITDMTDVLSEDLKEEIKNTTLLGRLGNIEDVANLALFLASDASSYITGEVIKVDGGMYV